ncbi:hypothetical protein WDZ11_00150 (plasmid) [Roseomonas mucosa]|uniref:hypothetical protein n=1 Tax=Roseomonas mucosa TaxID=207340 RepID=UPI0030D371BE
MNRHVAHLAGTTLTAATLFTGALEAARDARAEAAETDRWNALVARVQAAEGRAAALARELAAARAEAQELEETAFALAAQNETLRAAKARVHA